MNLETGALKCFLKTDTIIIYAFANSDTITYKNNFVNLDKTHYPFITKSMLYLIKNIEELEILNILISLQSQVNDVRFQDKLREQSYH